MTLRKVADADLHALVFKLAGQEYVVDQAQVLEIIRPTDLFRLSGMPGAARVEGVIKHRGHIVPVVDLKKQLGLTLGPPTPETCVIIVRLPIGPVGFVVDSTSELIWVKAQDFESPSPVIAGVDQVYIQGLAYLGNRLLVLLDLEQLLTPDEQQQLISETRLLQQPEAEPDRKKADVRSLIAFELSQELYAVSIDHVREVRELLACMPLPHVPAYVLGLINLRGVILPVIDLRRKFELPLQPDGPENRLIVLKGQGYLAALRVDRLHGLSRLPLADFQPAPAGVARIDPEYYEQVARLEGRVLIELNVQKMLADTSAGIKRSRSA